MIGALARRRRGPIGLGVGAGRYRAGIGDRAEQAMARRVAEFEVLGPWSLETSRRFWDGSTPAALAGVHPFRLAVYRRIGRRARASRGTPRGWRK